MYVCMSYVVQYNVATAGVGALGVETHPLLPIHTKVIIIYIL